MTRLQIGLFGCAILLSGGTSAWAASAGAVVDYDLGTGYHASYTDAATALGETSRTTGHGWGTDPPLYLSNPYSNPWQPGDWVSVGQGGFITLEMENYAVALDDAPEINVLAFQQILQSNGQPWYDRQAVVSVSENGVDWHALSGGTAISFDTPATGYVFADSIPNVDGTPGGIDPDDLHLYQASDYGLPMPGTLDFSNAASFEASRAEAYGLSGGGNWLDISATGLAQAGYIRFDVPFDAPDFLALDAIYLNHDAVGAPVPEPATLALVAGGLAFVATRRRVRVER
ncbi:MAG: PEP-CTERM sorting domain-containing protein [Phycisphaeraceae bacterium]